jgi:tetratricopeptide (TPR) repeat protein
MRIQFCARWGLVAVTAIGFLALSACGTSDPEPAAVPTTTGLGAKPAAELVPSGPLKNEIPSALLTEVMAAHYRGLGQMERYEYRAAGESFREVRKRAPGWIPGAVNLAIALLNDNGVKAEAAKKAGEEVSVSNFDESLELLAGVIEREPDNAHAHFCRGIILQQIGQHHLIEAHRHFKRVTEIDPTDAAGWYWMGSTVCDPDDVAKSDVRKLAPEQIPLFKKALELDPYNASAIY